MIAILGVGHLGEAILTGLLRAGLEPAEIAGSAQPAARAAHLTRTYEVPVAPDNVAPATGATTVLLTVPPETTEAVAAGIRPVLDPAAVVVSLVAGVSLNVLERALPGVALVRAMTNTTVAVDLGATVFTPGTKVSETQAAAVSDLFTRIGAVVQVPETDLDTATAVAGSGPAFVYYVTKALIDGATDLGMTGPAAWTLVTQLLYGTAVTLSNTGADPADLVADIASPGGTTRAGLDVLDSHQTAVAIKAAVAAAAARSRDLAAGSAAAR